MSRSKSCDSLSHEWWSTALFCLLAFVVLAVVAAWTNYRQQKVTEELLSTVVSYLASATDEEYDAIAASVRHDLVYSAFHNDVERFLRYIPNTAAGCAAEPDDTPEGLYLLGTNTGELYPLDPADPTVTFAYDEISQTDLCILPSPAENAVALVVLPGKSAVSIHRMKTLFCDRCIQNILTAVQESSTPEFVLLERTGRGGSTFYPLGSGTFGQLILTVRYGSP